MSISLSIFQKPCPGCAASVAIGAARCDCGHIFESAANNLSPLEASLREHGIARIRDVEMAVLEVDGSISVVPAGGETNRVHRRVRR